MQIGQDVKIVKWSPKLLLRSLRYGFSGYLGVGASQLQLNGYNFSNVKTLKLTIGAPGVAGCDFNFASVANTTEQVIDLGAVVPALARVLDIKTHTEVGFASNLSTFVAEVGSSSSGNQYIASGTILARNAIRAAAAGAALAIAPSASAGHIYVAATPGANWSNMVQGRVAVHVTYIEAVDVDSNDTTTTVAPTTTTTAAPTTTT